MVMRSCKKLVLLSGRLTYACGERSCKYLPLNLRPWHLASSALSSGTEVRPVASRSYKKLAEDVKPGSQILCADGSIVLEVLSTNVKAGTVHCKCLNNATLGYGCSHALLLPPVCLCLQT